MNINIELTKEELEELEKALLERQDSHFKRQEELKPLGVVTMPEREKALNDFILVRGILDKLSDYILEKEYGKQ